MNLRRKRVAVSAVQHIADASISSSVVSLMEGSLTLTSPCNLRHTLCGGQTFRFVEKLTQSPAESLFYGIDRGVLWRLYNEGNEIRYHVVAASKSRFSQLLDGCQPKKFNGSTALCASSVDSRKHFEHLLKTLFQTHIDAKSLLFSWKGVLADELTSSTAVSGVRVLSLDRFETLITFICSANNNIARITKLVNAFATEFGEDLFPIYEVGDVTILDEHGTTVCGKNYWAEATELKQIKGFPDLKSAVEKTRSMTDLEERFRALGYGYRAAYIVKTLTLLRDPAMQLEFDSSGEYKKKWEFLQTLPGVGPKVADCICLFGFGFQNAVPIDVHIKRITLQHYSRESKELKDMESRKGMTKKDYGTLGCWFADKFGMFSGWAQQWLFVSSLTRKSEGKDE